VFLPNLLLKKTILGLFSAFLYHLVHWENLYFNFSFGKDSYVYVCLINMLTSVFIIFL